MWIGKTKFEDPHATTLVEKMRKKLSNEFGVTVQGSCVTIRFYEKGDTGTEHLIQISMVIYDVDDGQREEFEDK